MSEDKNRRLVCKFPWHLCPYKLAILPLMKKDGLAEKAWSIFTNLRQKGIVCDYDDTGSIGKRYRRQDENGTFYCLTVDYQTLQDDTVTLRYRDNMQQVRIKLDDLANYLNSQSTSLFEV